MKIEDTKLWMEAKDAAERLAKGQRKWHAADGRHSEAGLNGFQAGAEWGFMRALRWLHASGKIKL